MGINYPYRKYKSARPRANLTTAALATSALIMILSIIQAYADNKLIDTVLDGGTVPDKILTDSYERSQNLWAAWTTMRIITAITFLTWIHRASRNLQALGNEAQQHSPAMAVNWWFIPFANLLMPYKVMKELWASSAPQSPAIRQNQRTKGTMSPLIGPWWGTWICSGLVLSAAAITARDDTLQAVRTFNTMNITGDTIGLLATVLAILIVQKITSNQEEKYVELMIAEQDKFEQEQREEQDQSQRDTKQQTNIDN